MRGAIEKNWNLLCFALFYLSYFFFLLLRE
nr:MAG TPA: hypothetical protein [Caudoviricetes sp.]